ncbi:MAG: hypothetical protein IJU26_07570 [Synergistaceae bacterium]|nr:hypothetical protein [Synergistaceae bacterium]
MLDFQPVTLGIKELVVSYTFKYGEGSCQHSFVSSWCLRHKYADEFCEHNAFLYTLRAKNALLTNACISFLTETEPTHKHSEMPFRIFLMTLTNTAQASSSRP